jgi:hypothetical protein
MLGTLGTLGTLGNLGGGLGGLGKDMQALSALQQIEKDVQSGNFANIGNSLALLKGKAASGEVAYLGYSFGLQARLTP